MIQLNILASLESYNTTLFRENPGKNARFEKHPTMTRMQFQSLLNNRKIVEQNENELYFRKDSATDI